MTHRRVAIVTADPDVRIAAARAFDRAPRSWSVRLFESPPPHADVLVVGPDAAGAVTGIRFDPARPDAVVDEVRAALAGPPGAVVVAGVCGGAGATTLALHLAASLGSALVDLSPDGAAARRIGIEEFRTFSSGDDPREASLPVAPGFRLLLAPGDADAARAASAEFGSVVVDASGSGVNAPVAARLLVLPPSLPAARRARRLLSAIGDEACAVIVNRTGPGGSASRTALEEALGRRLTMMLPCTPSLRDAEDEGRLLTSPFHRWTRSIRRLASVLERG